MTVEDGSNEASGAPAPGFWDIARGLVFRRYGVRGLAGLALLSLGFLLWWNWDHVRTLPGARWLISWMAEERLPRANDQQFSVAIGHLENDVDREYERLITSALGEWRGLEILRFDRTISPQGARPQEARRLGHRTAQDYLGESGADVMIWGEVLFPKKENSKAHLFWTVSEAPPEHLGSRGYQATAELELPHLFWSDLSSALNLIVLTHTNQFHRLRGDFITDRLHGFIERIRNLLRREQSDWPPEFAPFMWSTLGTALTIHGEATNDRALLEEAVEAQLRALDRYEDDQRTDSDVSRLNWAATAAGYGNALTRLAFHQQLIDRRASLRAAVEAYEQALGEFTQEEWSLDWALVSTNQAFALTELANEPERCSESYLRAAIAKAKEAAAVLERVGDPLDQARSILAVGNAEIGLGECIPDLQQMARSIATLQRAVERYPRARAPMGWARAQNILGTALTSLARRELTDDQTRDAAVARLRRADQVFERALEEWTAPQARWHRAMARINQARALLYLGVGLLSPQIAELSEADARKVVAEARGYLTRAEDACREGLEVLDRATIPSGAVADCAEVANWLARTPATQP